MVGDELNSPKKGSLLVYIYDIIYRVMVLYRLIKMCCLHIFVVLHHLFWITSHFCLYYIAFLDYITLLAILQSPFCYYFTVLATLPHTFSKLVIPENALFFCYYQQLPALPADQQLGTYQVQLVKLVNMQACELFNYDVSLKTGNQGSGYTGVIRNILNCQV